MFSIGRAFASASCIFGKHRENLYVMIVLHLTAVLWNIYVYIHADVLSSEGRLDEYSLQNLVEGYTDFATP